MAGKIMLIGLGELGFDILQFLARTPGISEIVTADKDGTRGLLKTQNVIHGAAHLGYYPRIQFRQLDVGDVKKTTEVLKEVQPTVLINATTLASPWMYHLLPKELYMKLHAGGVGPQVPLHLTLTYKLMRAVKESGLDMRVVSCSFPDVVNPMLTKIGLAPTVGGGNHCLLVPEIKRIVGEELHISLRNVTVFLVGHHGLLTAFMQTPFWVKILVDDKDVGDQFPLERLRKLLEPSVRRLLGGGEEWSIPYNEDIASSFLKNALAIYFDTGELCHATGVLGLPGGYPVHLSWKGAELALPEGLSEEEAIRIAEESGRIGDGIEQIKDDGTLVLTDKAAAAYKKVLEIKCKEIKIQESEDRAKELIEAFKRLGQKYDRT